MPPSHVDRAGGAARLLALRRGVVPRLGDVGVDISDNVERERGGAANATQDFGLMACMCFLL
jgi:hypothetical protein